MFAQNTARWKHYYTCEFHKFERSKSIALCVQSQYLCRSNATEWMVSEWRVECWRIEYFELCAVYTGWSKEVCQIWWAHQSRSNHWNDCLTQVSLINQPGTKTWQAHVPMEPEVFTHNTTITCANPHSAASIDINSTNIVVCDNYGTVYEVPLSLMQDKMAHISHLQGCNAFVSDMITAVEMDVKESNICCKHRDLVLRCIASKGDTYLKFYRSCANQVAMLRVNTSDYDLQQWQQRLKYNTNEICRISKEMKAARSQLLLSVVLWLYSNFAYVFCPYLDTMGIKQSKLSTRTKRCLEDASPGKFYSLLESHSGKYGGQLVSSNEQNSTKQYCFCGHLNKVTLTMRVYQCAYCKTDISRDANAARNILLNNLKQGISVTTSKYSKQNPMGAQKYCSFCTMVVKNKGSSKYTVFLVNGFESNKSSKCLF